ncbi:hypothetical protein B0H10DRAFT_1830823 [Mycena sp. CBHHK59/15]|nr:hypothetical protein B0H10DRAFT_1830823 [Mycena sp. CBHHK59/15]
MKLKIFWQDHQSWLAGCGYMLRPRYMLEWVPSWLGNPSLAAYMCEDGQIKFVFGQVMDATRTSDGKLVTLKRVDVKIHPFEAEIQLFLCTGKGPQEPLQSHLRGSQNTRRPRRDHSCHAISAALR